MPASTHTHFLCSLKFGLTILNAQGIPHSFLSYYVVHVFSAWGFAQYWNVNFSKKSSHKNITQALALQETHFVSLLFAHWWMHRSTVLEHLVEQEIYLFQWPGAYETKKCCAIKTTQCIQTIASKILKLLSYWEGKTLVFYSFSSGYLVAHYCATSSFAISTYHWTEFWVSWNRPHSHIISLYMLHELFPYSFLP